MSTPALSAETVPTLGEGQRLLNTFTAPSKTMADLKRKASWWVPWLLISITSLAFVFAIDKRIGWGQIIETQIQNNPKAAERLDRITPEQREKFMKQQATAARVLSYAAPVTTLLLLVAVAGVLVGVFNFGFGAKLKFKEMMGVTAYGFLPSILSTLLTVAVMFLVEPESFDIKYPIASSIGYFIPNTMAFWKTLLGAMDVFSIWTIFLLAIGVSQLSKVKRGAAFATVFTLFFLLKLAGALMSSI